ncbi:MAG: hypothetical protein ACRC2V_26240 [Xenococcaceae cyanobacterium]
MKQSAIEVLLQALYRLQQIGDYLYEASDAASEEGDFSEASLLQSVADKLYEETENLDVLISEMEEYENH